MATHGDAVHVRPAGFAYDVGEQPNQPPGVLRTHADRVAVRLVARGGPGITAGNEVCAQRGRGDGEGGSIALVAMGIQHQVAVPAVRHFDLVHGALVYSELGAGAGQRLKRRVSEVIGHRLGGDGKGERSGRRCGGRGGEGGGIRRRCRLGRGVAPTVAAAEDDG